MHDLGVVVNVSMQLECFTIEKRSILATLKRTHDVERHQMRVLHEIHTHLQLFILLLLLLNHQQILVINHRQNLVELLQSVAIVHVDDLLNIEFDSQVIYFLVAFHGGLKGT